MPSFLCLFVSGETTDLLLVKLWSKAANRDKYGTWDKEGGQWTYDLGEGSVHLGTTGRIGSVRDEDRMPPLLCRGRRIKKV
jgi:hypothetical protein